MAGDSVIDVLGLGIVTVDDFLYVPYFPKADAKVRVRQHLRQCGGLTGTALGWRFSLEPWLHAVAAHVIAPALAAN